MNFITSEPRLALGVRRSILGQPWHWRGMPADDLDASFAPDDLVTRLLPTALCGTG